MLKTKCANKKWIRLLAGLAVFVILAAGISFPSKAFDTIGEYPDRKALFAGDKTVAYIIDNGFTEADFRRLSDNKGGTVKIYNWMLDTVDKSITTVTFLPNGTYFTKYTLYVYRLINNEWVLQATNSNQYIQATMDLPSVVALAVYDPNGDEYELPIISDDVFLDVSKDAWFYEDVMFAYETKNASGTRLMSGYDGGKLFGPTDPLSRGQFATILYRMEGSPSTSFRRVFPDVSNGYFFSVPATWASNNGIITGYNNGYFGPNDNITREQLATILYRYANWNGWNTNIAGNVSAMKDAYKVSSFAKDAISWAMGAGIVTGKSNGTLIDPQGSASRAECAAMISRFVIAYSE